MGAAPAVHVKVTVTGELFHPLEFGCGVMEAVILGPVKSMFKVVVTVALFPALSVAVPETT